MAVSPAVILPGVIKTAQVFKETFFGGGKNYPVVPYSQWSPEVQKFFGRTPAADKARALEIALGQQAQSQQEQLVQAITSRIPTAYGGYSGGGGGGGFSWDFSTESGIYSGMTSAFPMFSLPDWTSSPAWLTEELPEWRSR